MIHRQEKLEKKFSPSQLQYLLNDSCNKCCGLPGHPTIGRAAAEHEKDLPLASRRRREHLKNRVVHGPQEFSKQKLGGLTPFFRSFQVESTDGHSAFLGCLGESHFRQPARSWLEHV